jgi:hypothetical protein
MVGFSSDAPRDVGEAEHQSLWGSGNVMFDLEVGTADGRYLIEIRTCDLLFTNPQCMKPKVAQ